MNRIRRNRSIATATTLGLTALIGWGTVAASSRAAAASDTSVKEERSSFTTGSGDLYRTTVDRYTDGALSADDLRQASLLASRAVRHVNGAVERLVDEDPGAAEAEIGKARELAKLVRDLLPVTTETTVVRTADGREVYREVGEIRDDEIPLYRETVAVELLEPIVDAKRNAPAFDGLRLADSDVIQTSVFADLGYLQRKLDRAAALVDDDPDGALAELVLAQVNGIDLRSLEGSDPLIAAQEALGLAERMVDEGNYRAAKDNLRLAEGRLATYREIAAPGASDEVKQLEQEIAALVPKVEEAGAAAKIRGFWDRAVSWIHHPSGEAHAMHRAATPSTGSTGKSS